MAKTVFDLEPCDVAWCPGCGNFGILNLLKEALTELEIPQKDLVMVSGIGQAAKIPQYMKVHYFNGLHGRALPPATAIKLTNPKLTVIAESGDGDMYGEGGNHFLHCIRRNPDITNIIHNNMVYGLTKGQASPTSARGFKTPLQIEGVILEPFNPLAVALALDASFVARIFPGHKEQAKEVLKKAILHKGYALVDVFQACVTFNKINTHQWFREHTVDLGDSHDPHDRVKAFARALETEKMPLGIFYEAPDKPVFEDQVAAYQKDKTPLFQRKLDPEKLSEAIKALRA